MSFVRLIMAASDVFVKEKRSPTASPAVSRKPRFSRTVSCRSPSEVMAVSVPPR